MQLVATLIAGPGVEPVLRAMVSELGVPADWLGPGACDISGVDEAAIRAAIAGKPIDLIVQPAAGRRKRLLVADFESTIIENEMLEELADFLGLRAPVTEITRRAMNGEIDFLAALTERVALLRGLSATVIAEAATRIRLMPGARALIATLVSGGFTVFAEPIAQALGFDRVVANRLALDGDKLAGTLIPPIVTGATKHETLLALIAELNLSLDQTLAVGDGANDLPMLQSAGLGIAFRAKPAVAAATRWRIDHADLTALLHAQGYRAREIVA
jgi:phosphoserine phosphatase